MRFMRRYFLLVLLVLAALLTLGTGLCAAMGVVAVLQEREKGFIGFVLLGTVVTVFLGMASWALFKRVRQPPPLPPDGKDRTDR